MAILRVFTVPLVTLSLPKSLDGSRVLWAELWEYLVGVEELLWLLLSFLSPREKNIAVNSHIISLKLKLKSSSAKLEIPFPEVHVLFALNLLVSNL